MSRLHPFWLIEMKIEPKSKGDQEKMGVALVKLATEDPSFRVSTDQESGETIIKGMGELHLDIKVDILRRTHKVEVAVGAPRHNAPVSSHDGNLPPFAPAMAMRVA